MALIYFSDLIKKKSQSGNRVPMVYWPPNEINWIEIELIANITLDWFTIGNNYIVLIMFRIHSHRLLVPAYAGFKICYIIWLLCQVSECVIFWSLIVRRLYCDTLRAEIYFRNIDIWRRFYQRIKTKLFKIVFIMIIAVQRYS